MGDALDKIAPGQQLHEQVGDLEQTVEVEHGVKIFAATEVFQFVAGLLFVEAFFDGPSGCVLLGR